VTYVEYRKAKTVTVHDVSILFPDLSRFMLMIRQVIHSLSRLGRPIYGFDPDTYSHTVVKKKRQEARRQGRPANDDDSD
jgi:histone H4